MKSTSFCCKRKDFIDTLILLAFTHGDTAKVMNEVAGNVKVERTEKVEKNDKALYHLKKIVGLSKEAQKHVDALAEIGIELYPMDNIGEVIVRSGIEKFRLPLSNDGTIKSFEHCGVEVWQTQTALK